MQRPDMAIHKFTKLIDKGLPVEVYGYGETARDYTYIDDIINGIKACIDYDTNFEIFNLGSGEVVKLKYLVDLISKQMNKKAIIKQMPLPKADAFYTASDISKANTLVGYEPKVKIEDGIEKFVNWFMHERIC